MNDTVLAVSSPRTALVRTPYQVALLMFATFGFYLVFWLIRNRWDAENVIGQRHRPWAAWLLALVPLVGFFVVFEAADVIEKGVSARNRRGPVPFWLYQLIGQVTGLIFWFVPLMQYYIYNAQVTADPDIPVPNFSWIEWIVLGLGAVFWIIFCEPANVDWTGWIVLFLAGMLLLVLPFWLATRSFDKKRQVTKCQYCQSEIPRTATVCRYCRGLQRSFESAP